jgi:CelD/BcsL family acetyltransferase involved in cellulose biosynthesis
MTQATLNWQNLSASQYLQDAELRAQWDALNAARANLPFLDSYAMTAALRVLGRGDERLLVGRSGGQTEAMFLLQRSGSGRWQTFQPSQLPLGAWVAIPAWPLIDLTQQLLRKPLGPILVLSITQIDPLHAPRVADGPAHTSSDYIDTAWIDIAGRFDDYWAQRGKNLRSNMRKQRNKLVSDGVQPVLLEWRARGDMLAALERYGALESAGWKASHGTAIHAANGQGCFYRQLMEAAADRGEAAVYEYRFGERSVAMHLCLERAGQMVILKTTYDESIDKSLSPALLLHQEELQAFFLAGQPHRLEYFGKVMEWHTRWTERQRTLYHLTCFRWPWLKRLKQRASRGANCGPAEAGAVPAPAVANVSV